MLKVSIMAAAAVVMISGAASAQYYGYGSNPSSNYNRGYMRDNGTYVAPHYRSNPNNTQLDNYGTRGNVNPYTGQRGTRSPRW